MRDIFVSAHLAIMYEVAVVVGLICVGMCKHVGSICLYGIMAMLPNLKYGSYICSLTSNMYTVT